MLYTLFLMNKTLFFFFFLLTKYKANNLIESYKARFVVKGSTQMYGIDYQEMFASAKMNTLCVLLSLVTNLE